MILKPKKWSSSSLWGSWNRQRINSVMRQQSLSEVRVGVLSKSEEKYEDNFLWVGISGNPSHDYFDYKGIYNTDYHSVTGSYSKIGLYMKDFKFDLEFAGNEDDFVYKIIPRTLQENYELFIGFLIGAQKKSFEGGHITLTDNGCIFNAKEGKFVIEIEGEISDTSFITPYPGLFFKCSSAIYVRCNNKRSRPEADNFLYTARQSYMKDMVYGEGFLGDGVVESVTKTMAWNKIYDNIHDTFKADVTRLWTPESCYYTFYWDNFFTSLLFGLEDEKMAYDQVDSVCSEFKKGFLPQCAFEWGSSDMLNPPVGSFCVLKLYKQFGDKAILEAYFEALYCTNTYLLENKSSEKNGILQLREERSRDALNTFNQILGTGLDNSPMYDNAKDVNLNDLGISSIYALDSWMLAEIAGILGKNEEKEILLKRYNIVKNAINEDMWDEDNGIYCNTTIAGDYQSVYSPTSFYPMIAGIATKERANRLVKEHLLNEKEFWGEFVIPSISKMNPAYDEQNYWRGCAWPPMNLLVYEGLKNYKFYDVAHQLARKSLHMYKQNWVDFGYVLENYSTKTGGISKNCVPMYTWGGLMAYMGIEEVFEASPLGGLKFGNLSGDYAAIRNLRVNQDFYDIITGQSMRVYKNKELFIETDVPAIIKNFVIKDNVCHVEIINRKPGKCVIFNKAQYVEVIINEINKRYEFVKGRADISLV